MVRELSPHDRLAGAFTGIVVIALPNWKTEDGFAFQDTFDRFKALADKKKHVYDEDIVALVDDEMASAHDRLKLASQSIVAGTEGPQQATLSLEIDGELHTHTASGDGPVDAIFNASRRCFRRMPPCRSIRSMR